MLTPAITVTSETSGIVTMPEANSEHGHKHKQGRQQKQDNISRRKLATGGRESSISRDINNSRDTIVRKNASRSRKGHDTSEHQKGYLHQQERQKQQGIVTSSTSISRDTTSCRDTIVRKNACFSR